MAFAYGAVGLNPDAELALHTVSIPDGLNAADLLLINRQENAALDLEGEFANVGGWLVAIYDGLEKLFEEEGTG